MSKFWESLSRNRRVPLDLETICAKAIEKEPGLRYRSAADMRDDLDRILQLLRVQPAIGTIARRATLSGVRRVTFSRVRYCLYYRVADDALQVLAFWHTSRGSEPPL